MQPKYHDTPAPTNYMGLPSKNGLNAFHWRADIEGRPVPPKVAYKKSGPKTKIEKEKAVIDYIATGAISFSRNSQADADKTARLKGRGMRV